MAKKEKFYVVWQGKKPGIYTSWKDCKAMIDGFAGAQYKSFPTFPEAKAAYNKDYKDVKATSKNKLLSIARILCLLLFSSLCPLLYSF